MCSCLLKTQLCSIIGVTFLCNLQAVVCGDSLVFLYIVIKHLYFQIYYKLRQDFIYQKAGC